MKSWRLMSITPTDPRVLRIWNCLIELIWRKSLNRPLEWREILLPHLFTRVALGARMRSMMITMWMRMRKLKKKRRRRRRRRGGERG